MMWVILGLSTKDATNYLANSIFKGLLMNIIRVEYRFLRLSTNLLALVELSSGCNIPQATTCLYPFPPYLTENRKYVVGLFENTIEWLVDQEFALELAVDEAKRHSIIDFKCSNPEYREVCLWVYRDPLVYWDEYCPLFDNEFNYILREE